MVGYCVSGTIVQKHIEKQAAIDLSRYCLHSHLKGFEIKAICGRVEGHLTTAS